MGSIDYLGDFLIALRPKAFHYYVLDMVRVRYLAKEEKVFVRGRLDFDIAEIEDSRDHTAYLRCNVLDPGKFEFADRTDKEAFLLDIDNAFIGDNPYIEVVIDPDQKSVHPDEKKKSVLEKEDDRQIGEHARLADDAWQSKEGGAEEPRKKYNENEVSGNVEPMAMNNRENSFALALAFEMVAAEIRRRHRLERKKRSVSHG